MKPLTGWMNTDAVNQVKCSKCGAEPEYSCTTPKGRKSLVPHNERVSELIGKVSAKPYELKRI
jgi:hypothetical protein